MTSNRSFKKPEGERSQAIERISGLFDLADSAFLERPDLSNKYVGLARKISMRYKVRIPSNLKRNFCKHCHHFIMKGKNCRIRIGDGKVTYTCLDCGKFMRFPYKKEQKEKKKGLKK